MSAEPGTGPSTGPNPTKFTDRIGNAMGLSTAALSATIIGFASSAVLIFQAAETLGATAQAYGSWIWASATAMGLLSIVLSLRFKVPVVIAWSTPGAALLASSAVQVGLAEAIGAFVLSALAMILVGVTGWFERVMNRVPQAIAGALLAGVLVRFGFDIFASMQSKLVLVLLMFIAFLIGRRFAPRYGIVLVLFTGGLVGWWQQIIDFSGIELSLVNPVFTVPQFSVSAAIGLALPLFVVTMASQNIPGVAVIRAHGYETPISPLITGSGIATLLFAPFGAFAVNLSALIAAICMGREVHPDPARRYWAAVIYGVIAVGIGLLGATVAGVFAALPVEFVAALAGLALLGPIALGLRQAMANDSDRDAALITFLIAASGVTLFEVGSAFWALVGAALVMAFTKRPAAAG